MSDYLWKDRAGIAFAAALALVAAGLMGCASSGDSEVTIAGDLIPSPIASPAPSAPAAADEETPPPSAPVAESEEPEVAAVSGPAHPDVPRRARPVGG